MAVRLCIQVEIKTTPQTVNPDVLQKAADFVHAFILGKRRWQASTAFGSLMTRCLQAVRSHCWLAPGLHRQQQHCVSKQMMIANPELACFCNDMLCNCGPCVVCAHVQTVLMLAVLCCADLARGVMYPQALRFVMPLRCCGWTTCMWSALKSRMSR
jgi:hypothetical protein